MITKWRTQSDDLQDVLSLESGSDVGPVNLARQEYKDAVDTNYILRRFGVGDFSGLNQRIPISDVVDYGMDLHDALHTALQAHAAARTAYDDLPEDIRRIYRSPEQFMDAIATGEVEISPTRKREKPPEKELKSETPTT